jgi:UTP:GlnB (protein PII) uridylyltransferase
MIDFNYTTLENEIVLTLKTDVTEIGTFHRMATVIYALGWNILSGDIKTITENGTEYAFDMLKIQSQGKNSVQKAADIGYLMDGIFSKKEDIKTLLQDYKFKPVEPRNFFREKAELIFEDDKKLNRTVFYIEADSGRGLLYHITKVLLDYKINIISGTIATDPITERAMDTFYLLDHNGNLFGNTEIANKIREDILRPL